MESPFSFNVRYLNRAGFPCQLTARAETSEEILKRISGIEQWLLASGATPAGPEGGNVALQPSAASAGAPSREPDPPAQAQQPEAREGAPAATDTTRSASAPSPNDGPVVCPIHNVPLQLVVTREGKALLLHKVEGEGYCNGQEVRKAAKGTSG
jgi:hypothetical protein